MTNSKTILHSVLSALLAAAMLLTVSCAPGEPGEKPDDTGDTAVESVTETDETEAETEAALPEAGLNPELTRDGTPKKYFTISFDDGIMQDEKIIEIMKKYDVHCVTFFVNTGLGGLDSSEGIANYLGKPGVTHIRYTMDELKTGIYDGYDVENHGLTHAVMAGSNPDPDTIKTEVGQNNANIAEFMGYEPVGYAWPGGAYDETTARAIAENSPIRFARAIDSTYSYALPEGFMHWQPTCSIIEKNMLDLAQDFVKAECTEDMLFYVWGHGYELDAYNLYNKLDLLMRIMSKADDVVLVTNAEFYQLFKDDIDLW